MSSVLQSSNLYNAAQVAVIVIESIIEQRPRISISSIRMVRTIFLVPFRSVAFDPELSRIASTIINVISLSSRFHFRPLVDSRP